MPTSQLRAAKGRIDSLWATAGLAPAAGHNIVTPLRTNLGAVDGEEAWRHGPLAALPKLMATMGEDQRFVAALREAFCARCRAAGLVGADGELVVVRHYRILDVQPTTVVAPAAGARTRLE